MPRCGRHVAKDQVSHPPAAKAHRARDAIDTRARDAPSPRRPGNTGRCRSEPTKSCTTLRDSLSSRSHSSLTLKGHFTTTSRVRDAGSRLALTPYLLWYDLPSYDVASLRADFYMEAAWSQRLSDSTHPNFMKVFGWGVRTTTCIAEPLPQSAPTACQHGPTSLPRSPQVRLNEDGTALDNREDSGFYLIIEKLGHDLDKVTEQPTARTRFRPPPPHPIGRRHLAHAECTAYPPRPDPSLAQFAGAHQFVWPDDLTELKYKPVDNHPDLRMFLREELIVGMVAGVASALLWLHSHNLVHRDVKGLNVMLGYAQDVLTSEPDVEVALARFVKLIDVGRVAKLADGAPAAATAHSFATAAAAAAAAAATPHCRDASSHFPACVAGNDPLFYRERMAVQYAQRSELSTPSFMPPELVSLKVAAEGHLHVMEGFNDVTFRVEGDVKENIIGRDPSIKDSTSVLFYFVHTTVKLVTHAVPHEATPTYTFVSRAYHHDDFVKLIDDLGGFFTAEEAKDKSKVASAGFFNTWKSLQDKDTADRRKVRYESLLEFIAERMSELGKADERALAPRQLRAFLNAGVTAVESQSNVLARARVELPKSDVYALGVMMYQLMDPQDRATQDNHGTPARLATVAQEVEDKRERHELDEDSWEFFQSTFTEGGDKIERRMFNYDGGVHGKAPYSDGARKLCIGM